MRGDMRLGPVYEEGLRASGWNLIGRWTVRIDLQGVPGTCGILGYLVDRWLYCGICVGSENRIVCARLYVGGRFLCQYRYNYASMSGGHLTRVDRYGPRSGEDAPCKAGTGHT